ncbi:hypothetical protein PYW08_012036 [Mythimna loreyi]|uniref:Uncharacterized protein n=1 Tax=Mythimna loreyi TaxID=667449 RepID=A0ACC2QLM9_9NEOP|nr:hypothetical protein PYW08_012036 [Mythimna loreyi]
MKLFIISLLLGLSSARDFSKVRLGCGDCQPQQVHIAFGEKVNDIVVTWSTFDDTVESIVEYGEGVMDQQSKGSSKRFVDGGLLKRSQYIHTVTLRDLKFNTSYVYHVGSVYGWSDQPRI